MEKRVQWLFFALCIAVLGLLLAAIRQADWPPWKAYQRNFHRLEAEQEPDANAKEAVLNTPFKIKQILLPGLHRVDRCTTCHLGVEDPAMKDAPRPFRYHADINLHKPAKFGCTVCHGGQGLATDSRDAHGNVAHWPEPLLPADYIRASCGRCHKEGEVPGVPELTEGRRLFETHGCRGCHKLNGVGGSLGPDLSEEGTKERSPSWLERHFLNPREVSPTSAMPNFHFTRRQARALTYYMLSLTNEQMGSFYTSVALIPSVAAGRQLFIEKNCITCHAIGGVGGKAGPDLLGTTKQHSRGWLEEQLLNPEFVSPGSTMPAYHLNRNSQRALIMFLASATAADAREVLRGRPATLSKAAAGIETGKQAFIRYGCVGCHGQNATGGVPNPNSQGGEIPSLIHVADDYTRAEVEDIIRNGKNPPLADPKKPVPPLYMPVWKNTLNKEDINAIIDYLWSLRPKNENNW